MKILTDAVYSRMSAFRSRRTDINNVLQLKNGSMPILENNKRNILASLNNLSSNPIRSNIEIMLDTADNLSYGEFGSAKFKAELDKDGITSEGRENTSWHELLKNAVKRAIASSDDEISDLNAEYDRIFSGGKELSPEQNRLLNLRKQLNYALSSSALLNTDEDLETAAAALEKLDYFTASSEIPLKQKNECLELLIYFMSSSYNINPALKDKKLQAADEILNDIIIKYPADKIIPAKTADQRNSGICAAISICRKAMAYEDKTRFIELILEELKDSPIMSVYDITELGSGKKIEMPKASVDYAAALKRGYRIIDASAHIWMNNAHFAGAGVQMENYIPFDTDNWGIYDDSSWYLGLENEMPGEKKLLSAVIKEQEFIKSVYDSRKAAYKASLSIKETENEILKVSRKARRELEKEFLTIFPDKSALWAASLASSLADFYRYKSAGNEVNISDKMPEKMKAGLAADFIIKHTNASGGKKELIKAEAEAFNKTAESIIEAEKKLEKLRGFSSKRSRYLYKKKLFKAAAAHRTAVEADVNLADGVLRFEKASGLPPRNVQIIDYLNRIGRKTGSSEAVKDAVKIQDIIPAEIDGILKILTGKSTAKMAAELILNQKRLIESGDKTALNYAADNFGFSGCDKNKAAEKLGRIAEKLSDYPPRTYVSSIIRQLNFENEFSFAWFILNSLTQQVQDGLFNRGNKRLLRISDIKIQEKKLEQLQKEYEQIISRHNIPSAREFIIKKLEDTGYILSRKKLDILKSRFEQIAQRTAENEQIQNMQKRNQADNLLYNFSREEDYIFKAVEKNLPVMKKYAKMQYSSLNKALKDRLEEQYSQIGMLNGQFWVREEGSSGLTSNEQIRILEQMTGKPFHIESDITKAAAQIKQGNGSGIISLSIDDKDYAFHAQYAPSVTEEYTDGETKEDVIWMDNTWGNAEKEHFWRGINGFRYTDYNRGFGWKNGFLLSDEFKTGLKVSDIFASKGTAKEDDEDFGLFSDMLLPGKSAKTTPKLLRMFEHIFSINEGEEQLKALVKEIKKGSAPDISFLDKIDAAAEQRSSILEKRLRKEIKSEEDFNKLPEDDPLKFAFEKIALYSASRDTEASNLILEASDRKELEEIHEIITAEKLNAFYAIAAKSDDCIDSLFVCCLPELEAILKELKAKYKINLSKIVKNRLFSGIFLSIGKEEYSGSIDSLERNIIKRLETASKTHIQNKEAAAYFRKRAEKIIKKVFDEEIRIVSLESNILKKNPAAGNFIAAIDKYLQPESDNALLNILQSFQNASFETAEEFIENLSDEDAGLEIRKPYDCARLFLSDDAGAQKAFYDIVQTEEACRYLKTDDAKNTAEELYRMLYVKLCDMDVQKYIKSFKAEAFQKYKVRQAFPEPVVLKDEEIIKMTENAAEFFRNSADGIEDSLRLYDFINQCSVLFNICLDDEKMKAASPGGNTDTDKAAINRLRNIIDDMIETAAPESSLSSVREALLPLKKLLDSGNINYAKTAVYLSKISEEFNGLINGGVTIQKIREHICSTSENIKKRMQLIVNANIEPRYRDEAIEIIKRLICLYKKRSSEEEIKKQENKLFDIITKRHIVKNPAELLKEYIRLVLKNEETSETGAVLRGYLSAALKTAQQTKVQYKLVQNQHEGISSKTKDVLPEFAASSGSGIEFELSSDEGMLYLIEQLENYNDNNVILKLFLAQTGLGRKAAAALINQFNMPVILKSIKDDYDEAEQNMQCAEKAAEKAEEFLHRSRIKYKSLDDALEQFKRYMTDNLKDFKNTDAFKLFIEYLESISQKEAADNNTEPDIFNEVLGEIYPFALGYASESINERIRNIEDIMEYLTNRHELINSAELPENSKEYAVREAFNKEFKEMLEFTEKRSREISDLADKCSILSLINE